jgi:hypothetical protein
MNSIITYLVLSSQSIDEEDVREPDVELEDLM